MSTRKIEPTDHQAQSVERLVPSGRYQNASEVLSEGLRLVERRESEKRARLNALREAARAGIADIEGGRVRDFRSTVHLQTHLSSLARRALARDPHAKDR